MIAQALASWKEKLLHGPQEGDSLPASPPEPETNPLPTAAEMPDMEFDEAKDVRAPKAPQEQEQTTREWALDYVRTSPEETQADLSKKIADFCGFNQKADYLEGPQDMAQIGLELNLEDWAGIVERLMNDEPVQVQEALETAEAIDHILVHAPEALWHGIRKENRKNLCALQGARDGPKHIEGETTKACTKNLGKMKTDLKIHKEIFEDAHLAISKKEIPSFESRTRRKVRRLSQMELEKAKARSQKKLRGDVPSPSRTFAQARPKQAEASQSL